MAETFTEDDVRRMLRDACLEAGGQDKFCAAVGLSNPYVSLVLNDHARPGPGIANALGLEMDRVWRRKTEVAP